MMFPAPKNMENRAMPSTSTSLNERRFTAAPPFLPDRCRNFAHAQFSIIEELPPVSY